MGSKMSFGRRSSDQNTISELTSVTPLPCNSIHAPSDFRQLPEDRRRSEEDLELLSGEKMKASELTETATESGNLESSDCVNVETVTKCQQSEHMSSQVGVEAQNQITPVCSSTTDGHGLPVEIRKKRGRPRKIKPLLTEEDTEPKTVGLGAVQHKEISTTIPLLACFENHNGGNLSKMVDCPLINNSDTSTVCNHISKDGVPVLLKRKRGRPRKSEVTAFISKVVNAATVSAPTASAHANVCGPARRLRSRGEQQHLAESGNTESENNEDHKQTKITLMESSTPPNIPGVKRKRPKPTDLQVPAKVFRLDESQRTSSVLSIITESKRGVTNKEVELNTDKQDTHADVEGGQISQKSRQGKEQKTGRKKVLLTQRRLRSNQMAQPEAIPSPDLTNISVVSTVQRDGPKLNQSVHSDSGKKSQTISNLDSFSKELPKSAEIPPAVKTENIDIELDNLDSVSEVNNPKSLHSNVRALVKSEDPNTQQIFLRLKKGGKKKRRRRRRKSNVLLQREGPTEDCEGNPDTQRKADCDSDKEANIKYIKHGRKTLLKCGYCYRLFKFLSQCLIHQRVHTGERPFKCAECGKGFSKNSNLNLHLKTHRKSNIYQKCPFCKIKFSCSEYDSHMKIHAQEMDQVCENNKSEKPSIADDQEDGHELNTPVSSEKRKRKVCQYCGKTFPFQSALVRHVRVHTGEKPYKCDICNKAFGQAYFLRVHELTHWSVKRYNCTRCEKSFTHYSNAKNHTCKPTERESDSVHSSRRMKPSLTYTCHICKNVFEHLQGFNSHMREHTGAKLYRCLYCDKLFGVLSEYDTHRSVCRGEKNASSSTIKEEGTMSLIQYSVPALRCSSGQNLASPPTSANSEMHEKLSKTTHRKRFANLKKPFKSTAVPDHRVVHLVSKLNKLDNRSDPRKYVCPSCGRLFRHMGRLRAHMLTHNPRQSYTCTCCGKTLENWRKLWQHQRIHRHRHGRFTCPQCGQGFRFVESYKKHMSEHPEFQWVQVRPKKVFLPYQCEHCICSFRTLDLLFSHQLCHSSTQEVQKDSYFDLSIEDHSTVLKEMSSPPTYQPSAVVHQETEESSPPLGPQCNYQDPLPQVSSFQQNHQAGLDDALLHPSSTWSIQDTETSCDRTDNALGKPITPLRTVKRQISEKNSQSNPASDVVNCAVCGNAYSAISDLYHHYLQHARGQL